MDSQNRSLEFAMLLTVPAAMALAVIPAPIVNVLFERGAFTALDTSQTASALRIFALGLPSFVLIKVFSPAYFAREDTATPMRYATISLTANTLGSIALFFLFRHLGLLPQLGIAVATALGGWLNAGLLWRTLVTRGQFVADPRFARALLMVLLSSLVMAGVLIGLAALLAPWLATGSPFLVRGGALAVLVGAGILAYAGLVLATGTLRLDQLRRLTGRKV
jgi:putative peptidoglycan lipid II flippase